MNIRSKLVFSAFFFFERSKAFKSEWEMTKNRGQNTTTLIRANVKRKIREVGQKFRAKIDFYVGLELCFAFPFAQRRAYGSYFTHGWGRGGEFSTARFGNVFCTLFHGG